MPSIPGDTTELRQRVEREHRVVSNSGIGVAKSPLRTLSGWAGRFALGFDLVCYRRDMMRHMKVTFSVPCLLACLIALSATACAHGASCRTTEFTATLNGDEAFSKSIGASLRLRLIPLKRAWGWVVSASPKSDDSQDWTYPVNMPLRTGERQVLGTGYGETVREKLQYEHSIRFVLNQMEFAMYSRMANETLESSDPDAAGRYIAAIQNATTGLVEIKALESTTSDDGETVKSSRLRFRVTVPTSFAIDPNLGWKSVPCPVNH